jgi:hypothetical protein
VLDPSRRVDEEYERKVLANYGLSLSRAHAAS